jgi:hypothetical protein
MDETTRRSIRKNVQAEGAMIAVGVLLVIMLGAVFAGSVLGSEVQATVFALALLGFASILMIRSLESGARARLIRALYFVGLMIFAGIILAIIELDHEAALGEALVLGMPPATALLVFGVSLFPFSFLILWVAGFSKAILPPEKAQQLERLRRKAPRQPEFKNGEADHHS